MTAEINQNFHPEETTYFPEFRSALQQARYTVAEHGRGTNFHAELLPEEEEVVTEFVQDTQFELLGVGRGRVTVGTDTVVVKVSRYGPRNELTAYGAYQNKWEAETWTECHHQRLVPVWTVSNDYQFLTAPRGTPLSNIEMSDDRKEELCTQLKETLDCRRVALQEVYPANVIQLGGLFKLGDYGDPPVDFVFPPHRDAENAIDLFLDDWGTPPDPASLVD